MSAAAHLLPKAARFAGSASTSSTPTSVLLNYQVLPPPGKRMGRYINQPDLGDTIDEHIPTPTLMHDGRRLEPPARLDTMGFELKIWPTEVSDFQNVSDIQSSYYAEMKSLIKEATGAEWVMIFDHTVRNTASRSLNAQVGGTAAPVSRVHCDYTADGAPRRLLQFGNSGVFSPVRDRVLDKADFQELAKQRFAFINVWRNIRGDPVERLPLAVCDAMTVPRSDYLLYELLFPDRTGENYSLRFNESHKWYYYPRMVKDECLIFKVYDKEEAGPRFVFHTAFEDPLTTPESPARESIEIRAVAFFAEPCS